MAQALVHRGPDEEGYFRRRGVELASRRLSIVGLADGQQPVANEDRSVSVVFNGELFDYIEQRSELETRGHRFVTHCDTEIIPHLWEESQEEMFVRLRGPICRRLVGRAQAAIDSWAGPLWHMSALLDTPGRLASVRLRNQGAAGLGHGAGPARPARDRSRLYFLRPAGAGDVL